MQELGAARRGADLPVGGQVEAAVVAVVAERRPRTGTRIIRGGAARRCRAASWKSSTRWLTW